MSVIYGYGVREGDGWAWEIRSHRPHGLFAPPDINEAHTYCAYLKSFYGHRPDNHHFHVEERFEAL